MPTFKYKTKVRGRVKEGVIDAENERAAAALLKQKKIKVDSIEVKKSWTEVELFASKQRITENDVVLFTRQFSTMIDAGLPLVQCLDILGKQSDNKTFGEVITDIKQNIEIGNTLADALRRHPDVFDGLFCNMVDAGETGGSLDVILQRLAVYIEKAQRLKSRVKSAMIYPSIIVLVAVLVVAIIMIFVIPPITKTFANAGVALPLPTIIVMKISDMFRTQWLTMIGSVVGFIFISKKIYATEKGRLEMDRFSLKLPVVGILIRKVSVAKFTRTLGTLLSGGVPLIEALNICARIAGNKVIENVIIKTIVSIKEGSSIAMPLSRGDVFPPMVIQMIDVGESSGALDTMLEKIADFYDQEVDTAVDALTAILEPAMIVVLGVVVGFIVIAMFMPMFKIGETI